jgi:hypothetical protein
MIPNLTPLGPLVRAVDTTPSHYSVHELPFAQPPMPAMRLATMNADGSVNYATPGNLKADNVSDVEELGDPGDNNSGGGHGEAPDGPAEDDADASQPSENSAHSRDTTLQDTNANVDSAATRQNAENRPEDDNEIGRDDIPYANDANDGERAHSPKQFDPTLVSVERDTLPKAAPRHPSGRFSSVLNTAGNTPDPHALADTYDGEAASTTPHGNGIWNDYKTAASRRERGDRVLPSGDAVPTPRTPEGTDSWRR